MQRAGGVGKHSQHVRRVRSVGRAFENALSLPGLLPVLLNPSVVISARHLLSRPVLAAHISVRLEKVASRSETVVVYSQKPRLSSDASVRLPARATHSPADSGASLRSSLRCGPCFVRRRQPAAPFSPTQHRSANHPRVGLKGAAVTANPEDSSTYRSVVRGAKLSRDHENLRFSVVSDPCRS